MFAFKHSKTVASIAAATLSSLILVACSASTAHIGALKVGKDKDVATEVSTFAPTDTIYAVADGANLPGKVTIKWQTIAEKVTGQQPNAAIDALDKSFDLDSDGTASYTLSPPNAGWPAGTYKIVVTMMDNGTQRDQKTAEITVSGSGSGNQ